MKTVALIGAGSLGHIFAGHFNEVLGGSYQLTGVMARTVEHSRQLAEEYGCRYYESLEELLKDQPDYVVELAGRDAVRLYAEKILTHKSSLVVASVGAMADETFSRKLEETAKENDVKVYLTSGAIGGFDLMRTLAAQKHIEAEITTTKAPGSLNGAPYLAGRLLSETEEETVFGGNAEDAIKGFPKNVNVAVATGIATCGVKETKVTIRSNPKTMKNSHFIHLKGENTEIRIQVETAPDKNNPKSSVLTAWSVLALLKNLESPIQFF